MHYRGERERGEKEQGPTLSRQEGGLAAQGPERTFPSVLTGWSVRSFPPEWAADQGSGGWGFVSGCKLFRSAFDFVLFCFCDGSSPWQCPQKEQKTWVLLLFAWLSLTGQMTSVLRPQITHL